MARTKSMQMALTLCFVETGDVDTPISLVAFLTTKRRYPKNPYTTVNIFDLYYDV